MKSRKDLEEFILNLPNTKLDYPFGEDVAVYKVALQEESANSEADWKMFALIPEKKTNPLNISLKCDPTLAKLLREKYESVMEGYHLNKKHWNTILLTGQLSDQEIIDLIVHSYNLVIGNKDHMPSL